MNTLKWIALIYMFFHMAIEGINILKIAREHGVATAFVVALMSLPLISIVIYVIWNCLPR